MEQISREKILETAMPLFAEQGFAGVGLRELAEQVGLSKSALFHHFPSKVRLYFSVLERVFAELDDRLASSDGPGVSELERLRSWVHSIIDAFAEHPPYAPLLLRALFDKQEETPYSERADGLLDGIFGRVGRALETGITNGEFRSVSVPQTIQTLVGLTLYHFASGDLGEDLLGKPLFSAEAVRERKQHIDDFVLHALAAPP